MTTPKAEVLYGTLGLMVLKTLETMAEAGSSVLGLEGNEPQCRRHG